jgi:A/G-specific adenine glycosylase
VVTAARSAAIRRRLVAWFDARRRDLPWRRDRDPYRVWVSEVMLQQTRIEVVLPAYERFVTAFPSLATLAGAREDDVLSLWSGLGYYSRARSLHRAARVLVAAGQVEFPRDPDAARELPGVGAYTAAAVLSIAYGAPLAAVDGNVVRVLSRLERLALPDGRGEPHATVAAGLLDRARPGDWNQAMMELGQTTCLPRGPRCEECPIASHCLALRDDVVDRYPPARPRRASEHHELSLVVLRDRDGRIVLERGAFAHLPHLWLPPLARPNDAAAGGRTLRDAGSFRHAILHRRFEVRVLAATVAGATLERAARRGVPDRAERGVFHPSDLARIGRSSLLTKALARAATQ